MRNPVLLDNTVLTNFALARCGNLPLKLWPDCVCTTEAVLEEYRRGVKTVSLPTGIWDYLPILHLTSEEEKWMKDSLPPYLALGECTALAAAVHRQGVFASDDRQARKTAQELNLSQ